MGIRLFVRAKWKGCIPTLAWWERSNLIPERVFGLFYVVYKKDAKTKGLSFFFPFRKESWFVLVLDNFKFITITKKSQSDVTISYFGKGNGSRSISFFLHFFHLYKLLEIQIKWRWRTLYGSNIYFLRSLVMEEMERIETLWKVFEEYPIF